MENLDLQDRIDSLQAFVDNSWHPKDRQKAANRLKALRATFGKEVNGRYTTNRKIVKLVGG